MYQYWFKFCEIKYFVFAGIAVSLYPTSCDVSGVDCTVLRLRSLFFVGICLSQLLKLFNQIRLCVYQNARVDKNSKQYQYIVKKWLVSQS